jgi:antitoxin component YwqK of YwqJK toxin-antitoxin module
VIQWKPDGSKQEEVVWKAGVVERNPAPIPSAKEGWQEQLDGLGRKRSAGEWRNGFEVGEWQFWHAEGGIEERATMAFGLRNGHSTTFNREGWIESTGDWRFGCRHGTWTWFHSNGRVRSRETYVFGTQEGPQFGWHDTGVIKEAGEFRNGRHFGRWRYWYPSGKLSCVEVHGENPQDQLRTLFNEDGERVLLRRLDGSDWPGVDDEDIDPAPPADIDERL